MKQSKSKIKGIIEAKKQQPHYTGVILRSGSDNLHWKTYRYKDDHWNDKFTTKEQKHVNDVTMKVAMEETMKKAMTHAKKDKRVTAWVTAKEINKPIDFDSELYTKPLVTFLDGRSVVRKFGKKDKRKGFINTKYNVKLKPKENKLLDSKVAKEWSAEQKTKAWYRP